jgi:hypothetical protein
MEDKRCIRLPKPLQRYQVSEEGNVNEIDEERIDLSSILYRGVRYGVKEVTDLGNYLQIEIEAPP